MTIQYRIQHIHIDDFSFFKELYSPGKEFQIKNQFSFGFNKADASFACVYLEEMMQAHKTFLSARLNVVVELSHESIENLKDNSSIVIPREFLVQIASINYGTMRGVVVANTQSIGVNDIIMPPMFLSNIIKEPMIIQMEEMAGK